MGGSGQKASARHELIPGNIFLVGLMGAGKTSVGKLLARRLGKTFHDCDQEIERATGVKIPVIFEIEGEAGFRAREALAIDALTALQGIVLATGGGAVLAEQNRRHLAARGTVVYLSARPEDLYERVRHDCNRSLLAGGEPLARLRELHLLRDPLYRSVADIVLETGAQSVQALARQLLDRLETEWKASA